MKRATRNAKQPTRFADMVSFATSSSENEPPRRKRLLNDSVSIKDDIQQLKSAMASHSQKKRNEHVRTYSKKESKHDKHVRTYSESEPKQDEHVGKLTLPKHSLSQPLIKNISSHSKYLSTSFSQRSPLTPHSPSDRTTNIDSHRNRSITPQILSDYTVHNGSDNSSTLYSSNHTVHVSHENRSLTPHSSSSRTADVDADYNCSLTSHSPSKKANDDGLLQIRDDVQKIVRELRDLPKKIADQLGSTIRDEVRRAIKAAFSQNAKVPYKPACLPFKSPEDIKKFDRLPNEVYADVVRYLSHVGGWTARSCANSILKEAANDEVFVNFTFTGYKGKNIFKGLRFAKACEEAMAANPNFQLTQTVFKDAITEALRSSKQRLRNRQELRVENAENSSDDETGDSYTDN